MKMNLVISYVLPDGTELGSATIDAEQLGKLTPKQMSATVCQAVKDLTAALIEKYSE